MTGRAEDGRYRRECSPRSRSFLAFQEDVAARLCCPVLGLGHLRLLAALCLAPVIAILARGTAVPLVGSHGAAGLVRLIVTFMPPALLLPHAGPASSEHHAIASVGARQAGRAGRVTRGLTKDCHAPPLLGQKCCPDCSLPLGLQKCDFVRF